MAVIGDLVFRLYEVIWRRLGGLRFEYEYLRVVKDGALEKVKSNGTFDLETSIFTDGIPAVPEVKDEKGNVVQAAIPAVPPALTATQRANLRALLKAQWDWNVANAARLGFNPAAGTDEELAP